MNIRLGAFELRFEASGKLASLSAEGAAPFLADSTHREHLGNGRWFEPRGWDECFPTIEPHGDSPILGDLVWMPPRFTADAASASQTWETPSYTATRRFRPEHRRRLAVDFAVRTAAPLSFLWASHALFSVGGLRRVEFAGGTRLEAFGLDGSSSKTFRKNEGPVRLVREDCEVVLESDQPWWGIWSNRGGWPAGRPAGIGVLGLEATTTASDLPGDAVLTAGGQFRGTVRLEVCS
jgi:hypothetical protein